MKCREVWSIGVLQVLGLSKRIRRVVQVGFWGVTLSVPNSYAAIEDVMTTDVSPRAFSVVWVSDAIVSDARIRVFSDADGTTEITDMSVDLVSATVSGAQAQGFGRLDITQLDNDTTYYYQLENISDGVSEFYPSAAPFIPVTTAVDVVINDGADVPVINNVLSHEAFSIDGFSSTEGVLVIVDIPGATMSPMATFVGDAMPPEQGLVDLTNLYAGDGERLDISPFQIMTITEFRGFERCPGLIDHSITRFRYAPSDTGVFPYTQVEQAPLCDPYDLNCDGTINTVDVQLITDASSAVFGSCLFHPDLDVVADNIIDGFDEQAVVDASN